MIIMFIMKLYSVVLLCYLNFIEITCVEFPIPKQDFIKSGQDEIQEALGLRENRNRAKNIILFIGDGMDFQTLWATRVYQGQRQDGWAGEENTLFFEKFPNSGHLKTYSLSDQTPESGQTASALMTGRKNYRDVLGLTDNIQPNYCNHTKESDTERIPTLLEMAYAANKATGFVSTARVTHATNAAVYSHTASRTWESDKDLTSNAVNCGAEEPPCQCKDIARQLVEDHHYINVVMGGGRRALMPDSEADPEHPDKSGIRSDGRNLINEWQTKQASLGLNYKYVWNKEEFDKVNSKKTDRLLGLFEHAHMNFESNRIQEADPSEPSLSEMTRTAISILQNQKGKDGFFIMIEGAHIDSGHHATKAGLAITETLEFENAIKVAREMTSDSDTLIVVTADHSQALIAGGDAGRGADVLGADNRQFMQPDLQGLPRLILGYHNGPGFGDGFTRRDHTGVDTADLNFIQDSLYPAPSSTHTPLDVPLFATGPWSHLFHGLHEQSYVAHVMAYAACVGDGRFMTSCDQTDRPLPPVTMAATSTRGMLALILSAVLVAIARIF